MIPPEVTLIYLGVALPIIGLTRFKMLAQKKKTFCTSDKTHLGRLSFLNGVAANFNPEKL